jgi:hypothetical protein
MINNLLRKAPVQLASGDQILSWGRCLGRIKKSGFEPRTIFDIGVYKGTDVLYRAFPEAFYYLIDPSR